MRHSYRMALQRITNRSPWTVTANDVRLLPGQTGYVENDRADLLCDEGVVMARVVEWPDETTEVVINAVNA
jgi:hypothetical protein